MEGSDTQPADIQSAKDITVKKPGSNMLWVTITWSEEDQDMFSVKATPQNEILFDRDEYEFNGKSLYSMLFGDAHERVVLSREPFVGIKPGPYEDTYRLWFENELEPIMTTPDQSSEVLRGVVELSRSNNPTKLKDVYNNVKDCQINRDAIMALYREEQIDNSRVKPEADGLVIDGYFLLTWEGEFHMYTETWENGAFTPNGNAKDKPGEFREWEIEIEKSETKFRSESGVIYTLTELEQMFIKKLVKILNWEEELEDQTVRAIERSVPIMQEHNI